MDGQIRDFTYQIPQRDIHGADRPDHRQSTAPPDALIELLAVEWILSQQQGFQALDQGAPLDLGVPGRTSQKCVARHALVGGDRQQSQCGGPSRQADVHSIGHGRDTVPAEQRQRHVDNFHDSLSSQRMLVALAAGNDSQQ